MSIARVSAVPRFTRNFTSCIDLSRDAARKSCDGAEGFHLPTPPTNCMQRIVVRCGRDAHAFAGLIDPVRPAEGSTQDSKVSHSLRRFPIIRMPGRISY